jgi:hypothetical protein
MAAMDQSARFLCALAGALLGSGIAAVGSSPWLGSVLLLGGVGVAVLALRLARSHRGERLVVTHHRDARPWESGDASADPGSNVHVVEQQDG